MEDPKTKQSTDQLIDAEWKRAMREKIRYCVESTIPVFTRNPFKYLLKGSISVNVSNYAQMLMMEDEHKERLANV